MRLVDRRADGWVPTLSWTHRLPSPRRTSAFDDAAIAAGREPAAIRHVLNIGPGLVHPEAPAELGQVPGIDTFILMSDDPG
ncbi:hypothetical protein SUDANB174_06184 [Streptomyces sp. enrichment culture]